MKWIALLDTLCQKSVLICVISDINMILHPNIFIGGFRGEPHPAHTPPKGPNSFILTYKFYET